MWTIFVFSTACTCEPNICGNRTCSRFAGESDRTGKELAPVQRNRMTDEDAFQVRTIWGVGGMFAVGRTKFYPRGRANFSASYQISGLREACAVGERLCPTLCHWQFKKLLSKRLENQHPLPSQFKPPTSPAFEHFPLTHKYPIVSTMLVSLTSLLYAAVALMAIVQSQPLPRGEDLLDRPKQTLIHESLQP
jgi:hypothetical protein